MGCAQSKESPAAVAPHDSPVKVEKPHGSSLIGASAIHPEVVSTKVTTPSKVDHKGTATPTKEKEEAPSPLDHYLRSTANEHSSHAAKPAVGDSMMVSYGGEDKDDDRGDDGGGHHKASTKPAIATLEEVEEGNPVIYNSPVAPKRIAAEPRGAAEIASGDNWKAEALGKETEPAPPAGESTPVVPMSPIASGVPEPQPASAAVTPNVVNENRGSTEGAAEEEEDGIGSLVDLPSKPNPNAGRDITSMVVETGDEEEDPFIDVEETEDDGQPSKINLEDYDEPFQDVDDSSDDDADDNKLKESVLNDWLESDDINEDDIADTLKIASEEKDPEKVIKFITERRTSKVLTNKSASIARLTSMEHMILRSHKDKDVIIEEDVLSEEAEDESGPYVSEREKDSERDMSSMSDALESEVTSSEPPISKGSGLSSDAKKKLRVIQFGVLATENKTVYVKERRTSVKDSVKVVVETNEAGQKLVNGYRIEKLLGSGAYGKVKLCRKGDKRYAIKMMKRNIIQKSKLSKQNDDGMDLFRREVAIMKKLKHPNIVELKEVIDDPNCSKFYLVLEYVENGQVLHDGKPSSETLARKYMRDICRGLEYLHFQNVIHRDIKPENLLIGHDGIIKMADFGVSGIVTNAEEKLKETQGTPAFQAPEICAGNEYDGPAVDIWALGVSLYMMLYAVIPFYASSLNETYRLIQEEPVKFSQSKMISKEGKDLIMAMLTKDPRSRITLREIMLHPWVTENGKQPLPLTEYVLIKVTQSDVESAFSPVDNLLMVIKVKATVSRLLRGARKQLEDAADKEKEKTSRKVSTKKGGEEDNRVDSKGEVTRSTQSSLDKISSGSSRDGSGGKGIGQKKIVRSKTMYTQKTSVIQEKTPQNSMIKQKEVFENFVKNLDEGGSKKSSINNKKSPRAAASSADADSDGDEDEAGTPNRKGVFDVIPKCLSKTMGNNDEVVNSKPANQAASMIAGELDRSGTETEEASEGEAAKTEKGKMRGGNILEVARRFTVANLDIYDRDVLPILKQVVTKENTDFIKELGYATFLNDSLYSVETVDLDLYSKDAERDSETEESNVVKSPRVIKRTNDFVMVTKGFKVADGEKDDGTGNQKMKKETILLKNTGSHRGDKIAKALKDVLEEESEEDDDLGELSEEDEDGVKRAKDDDETFETCDDFGVFDDLIEKEKKDEMVEEQVYPFKDKNFSTKYVISHAANRILKTRSGEGHLQGKRATMEDASSMHNDLWYPSFNAVKMGKATAPNGLPVTQHEVGFFAIFDGHNGTGTSDYLADRLHIKLALNYVNDDSIDSKLEQVFEETDKEILAITGENKIFSGSTAITLLLRKTKEGKVEAICGNVGDSRCILSSAGKAIPMSLDQKPYNDDEKKRIQAAGGWVSNKRVNGVLAVSRAFGDIEYKTLKEKCWEKSFTADCVICKPVLKKHIVGPDDEFFVLACDGVWDVMSNQAVVNKVRQSLEKHSDVTQAAKDLVKEALDRNSIDNVSALIVCVNQDF